MVFLVYLPRSEGGDLPISRRCHNGLHGACRGLWTATYPDEEQGPCECACHTDTL